MAKIMATEMIAGGSWIDLNRAYYYLTLDGGMRTWEFASRRNSNGVVTIIPITTNNYVVVISQFRVPTNSICWEFPAGLIDKGESPTEAAIRELKEETGLIGEVISVSPFLYTSPGLSNESGCLVRMSVDFDKQGETHFDDSEDITTMCIPQDQLLSFIDGKIKQGNAIDCKLYMWAMAHLN